MPSLLTLCFSLLFTLTGQAAFIEAARTNPMYTSSTSMLSSDLIKTDREGNDDEEPDCD